VKRIYIYIAAAMIGVAAIVAVVWTAVRQYREHYRDAITSLGNPMQLGPDGRHVRLLIGGNEYKETRIVLIAHRDAIAPNWNEIDPRTRFSTDDPVLGLKSQANLVTSYPADPEKSGLWIEGEKQTLEDGLNVVFISERLPATRVAVSPEEEEQFLDGIYEADLYHFIDKWVMPRLPPAPPGPTVDEVIRSLKSQR
jgi:hypothetical protein